MPTSSPSRACSRPTPPSRCWSSPSSPSSNLPRRAWSRSHKPKPWGTSMSEPVEPLLPSEQVTAVAEVEPTVDAVHLTRILEAALLTTQEPLSITELKRLSEAPLETKYVEELLQQLADKYAT